MNSKTSFRSRESACHPSPENGNGVLSCSPLRAPISYTGGQLRWTSSNSDSAIEERREAIDKILLELVHTHLDNDDIRIFLQLSAEACARRELEGYEATLGEKHPHTLILVNNLGLLLQDQGKLEEAEVYYRRVL